VRMNQIFPQASKNRQCDLPFVRVHDTLHCENNISRKPTVRLRCP
jgi:hypothetical protein